MFSMTGTTGSHFTGVFATSAGQIGFRNLGGDQFRVRVEPKNGKGLNLPEWKQPDSQNRYSTVVEGLDNLAAAIAEGTAAIAAASELKTTKQVTVEIEVAPYFA